VRGQQIKYFTPRISRANDLLRKTGLDEQIKKLVPGKENAKLWTAFNWLWVVTYEGPS